MPLARFQLSELDVTHHIEGQRSGGAIRSSSTRRSARRKSPYGSGISPALDGLALGSVTRARAKWAAVQAPVQTLAQDTQPAAPIPVGAAARGCGGARGPLERQLEKEARFTAKRDAETERQLSDPAAMPTRSPKRSTSLIAPHLGGRSVDQWRDEAWEQFVGTSLASRPSKPSKHASSSASSEKIASLKLEPLPSRGVGSVLPPLRGAKQLERQRRLAARAKEAKQREEQTRQQREAVFAGGS